MKIYFWGTRGSLPTSFTSHKLRGKIIKILKSARGESLSNDREINEFIEKKLPFSLSNTYGCNTLCVELLNPLGEYILLDAGTGIRDFAESFVKSGKSGKRNTFHIFITHLHWDHIQGFPFFTPIYIPGNRIIIHGYHETIPEVFKYQMSAPTFPVPYDSVAASIEFDIKSPCEPFSVGGFEITAIEQNHPGTSYGFRFSKNGKSVVYSTDSEHKEDASLEDYRFIEFFKDADLVIFDAQYSLSDAAFNKADWGHSSNILGVELAMRSNVKHLCLFHSEPTASDEDLDVFHTNTRAYSEMYGKSQANENNDHTLPTISLAYDGLELEI